MVQSASKTATPSGTASSASASSSGSTGVEAAASTTTSPVPRPAGDDHPPHVGGTVRQRVATPAHPPPKVMIMATSGHARPMLAEPHDASGAGYGLGTLIAVLSAVLFAVGAVLQHEAAESSTTDAGLSWRQLMRRPKWFAGQLATICGTGLQVAALALAPVAVVQPVLAVALVVALGIRAVRNRQVPLRLELIGAGLTTGGLAVFLVAAKPATGEHTHEPSAIAVLTAVGVSIVLVTVATLLKHGAHGALACGCAAG